MQRKSKGSIHFGILFSWMLFLLIILGAFAIEIYFTNQKAEIAQDDIVLSNLAVYKVLDLKELGGNPQVFKISDCNLALNTFKQYLVKNMVLDSSLKGLDGSIAVGQVSITTYIVYNISGNSAEITTYNPSTNNFVQTVVNDINTTPVYSPNGVQIRKTSVYTVIQFYIAPMLKGILGNQLSVKVGAHTDITY